MSSLCVRVFFHRWGVLPRPTGRGHPRLPSHNHHYVVRVESCLSLRLIRFALVKSGAKFGHVQSTTAPNSAPSDPVWPVECATRARLGMKTSDEPPLVSCNLPSTYRRRASMHRQRPAFNIEIKQAKRRALMHEMRLPHHAHAPPHRPNPIPKTRPEGRWIVCDPWRGAGGRRCEAIRSILDYGVGRCRTRLPVVLWI